MGQLDSPENVATAEMGHEPQSPEDVRTWRHIVAAVTADRSRRRDAIRPSDFDTYASDDGTALHIYDGDQGDAVTVVTLGDASIVSLLHELAGALEYHGDGDLASLGAKLREHTEGAL